MNLDTLGRRVRAASTYSRAATCGAGHPKTISYGRFYTHPSGRRYWKCLSCQRVISARRRAEERAMLAEYREVSL